MSGRWLTVCTTRTHSHSLTPTHCEPASHHRRSLTHSLTHSHSQSLTATHTATVLVTTHFVRTLVFSPINPHTRRYHIQRTVVVRCPHRILSHYVFSAFHFVYSFDQGLRWHHCSHSLPLHCSPLTHCRRPQSLTHSQCTHCGWVGAVNNNNNNASQ